MKTKNLSLAEAKELLEKVNNIIAFNNLLNAEVRKYRKLNNITHNTFNGYHPYDKENTYKFSSKDIEFIKSFVDKQSWMSDDIKDAYIRQAGNIIGQIWSISVNTYHLKDKHDLESYIKTLENVQDKTQQETAFFKIERDIEHTRLNLYFDGIPTPQERNILKQEGFKWSPYLMAWTRQLTTNAEYSLNRVINRFTSLNA